MCLTSLLRAHAPDNLCSVFNCLLGVERPLFARESLVDNFGLFVDAEIRERLHVLLSAESRDGEPPVLVTGCTAGESTSGGRQH